MKINDYAGLPSFSWDQHRRAPGIYRALSGFSAFFIAVADREGDIIEVRVKKNGHFVIRSYTEKFD